MQLEMELAGGQLTGQVLPAQACRIVIQSPSAAPHTIDVDDSGFFEVADVPAGPLRFRVELGGSRAGVNLGRLTGVATC